MSASECTKKPVGMAVSIDDEVTKATEEPRKLLDRQNEAQREECELNKTAVFAFIKAEKLDYVSVNVWISALPSIKKLLATEKTGRREGELSESRGDNAENSTIETWRSIFPAGQDELLWTVVAKL